MGIRNVKTKKGEGKVERLFFIYKKKPKPKSKN